MFDSHAFLYVSNLNILTVLLGVETLKQGNTMPTFRITTKQMINSNGVRLEPGMYVDIVTKSFSNPVSTNGGQAVADAFMRMYGVDIKKACALNMVYLNVKLNK
jgi:hypothetical protein